MPSNLAAISPLVDARPLQAAQDDIEGPCPRDGSGDQSGQIAALVGPVLQKFDLIGIADLFDLVQKGTKPLLHQKQRLEPGAIQIVEEIDHDPLPTPADQVGQKDENLDPAVVLHQITVPLVRCSAPARLFLRHSNSLRAVEVALNFSSTRLRDALLRSSARPGCLRTFSIAAAISSGLP